MKHRVLASRRAHLLADERQEMAAPELAAEWTVRQEVVDAWKRLGSMFNVALAQYPTATQRLPLPRRMVPSFRWYGMSVASYSC
jgi:hypothetical protein